MGDPVIDRTMAVRIATQLGWEPKREWVGLTDEEYEAIEASGEFGKGSLRFKNIFNAIEAKLKEKNT